MADERHVFVRDGTGERQMPGVVSFHATDCRSMRFYYGHTFRKIRNP
jgi:hypothetical protein